MKEKFEHKLVNKIKDTFDSHEAEYNPQDWELLMDKLPVKRSALPLFWVLARAAVVLLLVALGSYFLWDGLIDKDSKIDNNETMVETKHEQGEEIDKVPNQTIESNSFNVQENLAKKIENENSKNGGQRLIENKTQSHTDPIAEVVLSNEPQTIEAIISQNSKMDSLSALVENSDIIIAESYVEREDSLIQQSDLTIQPVIAQIEPLPDIYENIKAKKKKVRLGAEFASFTNYSPENVSPGLNYGGGVTADIPIKKRFSFNPGLIVSVYNMDFDGNPNSIDAAQPSSYSVYSLHTSDSDIIPSKMQLTSLDIPVNFQYQFLQRKTSDFFVELGFSSLLYLSEDFEYTFVSTSGGPFPNDTEIANDNTVSGEVSVDAFNTFDFAKLINISVGMDYRLNKRLDFTVNPFLKYPVSTLTSGDIKFGSGGLKLKFMIKPGK